MTDTPPTPAFFDLFNKTPATPPPATPPSNGTTPTPPTDPERAGRYAAAALRDECAGMAAQTKPGRNVRLNLAAFNIAQFVANGHLDHTEAWQQLAAAARTTGLPEAEIATTLNSAFKAGVLLPRAIPERAPLPAPGILVGAPPTDTAGNAVQPSLELPVNLCLDWDDLFSTDPQEEEWIVEPLLPARRMVALYSEAKAGKSLLILEVAVAISRGTPVLGHRPGRPYRVLYVDFENDPQGDIRTRLEDMDIGPDQLGNLVYLSFPSLAKFDTAAGAVDLMRHVEHYECEVVVIDTVSRAVTGEENDNDTWLAFYRHTGLALKRAGVACIRLDHSGKDRERGMRGGSAKSGDVDAVWQLSAPTPTNVLLECTHHRMPIRVNRLILVRGAEPLEHTVTDNPLALVDERTRELDEELDALGVPPDATQAVLKKALKDAGIRCGSIPAQAVQRYRKNKPTVLQPPITNP